MEKKFNPAENYRSTQEKIDYQTLHDSTTEVYQKLGFQSGLEVHQQLKTEKKLFCRCPAGKYHDLDSYDAEIIRHMRPTLSEMGTYDGTALMEFKTRKNITYRIGNETTCTYEIDDTPPFPINREALRYAIEIALLLKLNIVGELHITRKQYLDGSIPTGFQRTAIVGIEGIIPLRNKQVRIIQLSVEEDSCREVSDIGHERIYSTDRLGIPLIETVTYPDMKTPAEVKEAAQYIRFMNRSTGKVRTGIGAGRQDVNVSIEGGTRVEIKGVSHISWIPALTHNEAFRQKALLSIKAELAKRIKSAENWKFTYKLFNFDAEDVQYEPIKNAIAQGHKLVAVNLPEFRGILSHFTQPGQSFADEISDRLKVIACLEKPNMVYSEDQQPVFDQNLLSRRSRLLGSEDNDAQIVFWSSEDDLKTAVETIEERCRLAFQGVPNETRKARSDGSTVFERVLPGADRMYPDTDSAPIPIEDADIDQIREHLPVDLNERIIQLQEWQIPQDCYVYLLRNNLIPLLEDLISDFGLEPVYCATFLAHKLKYVQGHHESSLTFNFMRIYELFEFLIEKKIQLDLATELLPVIFQYPRMDFDSVLNTVKFTRHKPDKLKKEIPALKKIFPSLRRSSHPQAEAKWIMGQLRSSAIGNIALAELWKNVLAESGSNEEVKHD
ncbi:MAG: Glu-tRNA(Gln) amidotransferase subunit GatE [Candidatus Cloacimonetes bacterium]|nr:Glu-tRNA(Gln) amidotransferase subunit GatE [Candidatus Cloacimonadota bacterium]